jgi:hypothetical protein
MDTFDSHSTDGYSHSSSHAFGYSVSVSEGISPGHSFGVSPYPVSISISEDTTTDDAVRIARAIFTAEVADLITVLRNCGALGSREESFWCLKEVWRLLADRSTGDMT